MPTDDGGGTGSDGGSADGSTDVPGMINCDCRTLPDRRSTLPTAVLVLALLFTFRRRTPR
jgi:MYXO-CTERM domain-containing protein